MLPLAARRTRVKAAAPADDAISCSVLDCVGFVGFFFFIYSDFTIREGFAQGSSGSGSRWGCPAMGEAGLGQN